MKWFDVEPKDFGPHNAFADIVGVRKANVLIVLMDEDRQFRGTWCEVGMALAWGKPCYFIGHVNSDRVVFMSHPLIKSFIPEWPFEDEITGVVAASKRFIDKDKDGRYVQNYFPDFGSVAEQNEKIAE